MPQQHAHARRCHLCKELAPIWERLAEELEGEQYVAKVRHHSHAIAQSSPPMQSQIDVTQQRVLLQRFGVQGVPAIFHLKDGLTREHDGPRTYKDVCD